MKKHKLYVYANMGYDSIASVDTYHSLEERPWSAFTSRKPNTYTLFGNKGDNLVLTVTDEKGITTLYTNPPKIIIQELNND